MPARWSRALLQADTGPRFPTFPFLSTREGVAAGVGGGTAGLGCGGSEGRPASRDPQPQRQAEMRTPRPGGAATVRGHAESLDRGNRE